MAAGAVLAGAGQGSGSFLFPVIIPDCAGTLGFGFLFPMAATGFQFGNTLLQSPNLLFAFQGLGLPPIAALLKELTQLVGRTRIRVVFLDGFHEHFLCGPKNRRRTENVLITKITFIVLLTCF
jgi:hypothetical protein